MPRWYSDGYEAPPDDRSGGAVFMILLAISVAAIVVGSGWLTLNRLGGHADSVVTTSAIATPVATAQPTAAPTAVPAARVQVIPVPDWALPNGHFYTQTNRAPALSSTAGYAVTNDQGQPFWDEFRRLGDVPVVGFPISQRFQWQGLPTQIFQRAVLQWQPALHRMQAVNILDLLHDRGRDQWLLESFATPKPLAPDFDQGKTPAEVASARLSLLRYDPIMMAFYLSAPDPTMLYGLPASSVTDMGTHYAIRLQRGVLQRWKTGQPWAQANQVTAANAGQLAVAAGLFPTEVIAPLPAPQ